MNPVTYREQVYAVLADSGESFDTKISRILDIGTGYLDLSIGFFSRIDEETQEIVVSTGNHPLLQPGESCPLEKAYCRKTIEIESPLAVQDADDSTVISESAIETFNLGSYIGARILVDDAIYGTVCFADSETRQEPFTDAESYFVELVARLIGQTLEHQVYELELAAREDEVRTKEEVYRAVVDASFDLVFQIDGDGRFSYISESIEDLLDYGPEEFLGKPFTAMLPDQETIEVAESVYQQVLTGETVQKEYFPLEHRSGDQVLVDIRVTPLYRGDVPAVERTPADIIGVQGMARDATDRQRRQRMIHVLNRVLRHNLRNEMNIISGYAEVLESNLSAENADYARRIGDTSDRLVKLSETSRKLEKYLDEPPELEAIDVVPIVRRVANQVTDQYSSASITVTTSKAAVANGAPRLETAVWELVENAAKHAGENPSIEITVLEEDSEVLIRISDDGPGLPEQERELLVAGEETPLVHGSGLGLWLVHWIIESLDGDLQLDDDETNSCIEISLQGENDLGN